MQKKISLSIVIPIFNNQQAVKELLASINSSRFSHFDKIEVILVDDGSDTEHAKKNAKLSTRWKFTLSLHRLKKNRGPAYARNMGVKRARGRYILFLDADVTLRKNTLARAFDFFKKKRGRAFTGIWHYRQKTTKFFPQFKALRDWVYWFDERERGARYYLFSTRIAGIEKQLFTQLGGFTEAYAKPTVEDIELTYRIEKHTKIAFVPGIVVSHEFEDFIPIAKKYFARSRDWIKLYIGRLRFDPVATSKREAKKSVYVGLAAVFLVVFAATRVLSFLYLALVSFTIFLAYEAGFLQFLYKKKGVVFVLLAIPTSLVLYLIIDVGIVIGGTEYYFKKLNGLSAPPRRTSK